MSEKKKYQPQETWSIDMLQHFKDSLVNSLLPEIYLVLKRVERHMYLTNTSKNYHSGCLCELVGFEFKNVGFGLNPLDSSAEEYRDYLGYIEILDGYAEGEPAPIMRGFIKQDVTFFESLCKMAIECRLLNPKSLVALTINLDPSAIRDLKNTPTEKILNMKLPIRSIEISHELSFV